MNPYTANYPSAVPTGAETLVVDTNTGGGAAPQVAKFGLGQLGNINTPRNLLDGGDFGVNPWQRGTSFTGIGSTLTYTADRWFAVGGGSSSISVSQQAITAGSLPGFASALQFGRASSNADTTAIKLGQVIETGDAVRMQGQNAVLSFYAIAGANFSAAGGVVTATVYSGTGTNQSAANMIAGSWTGQATVYTGPASIVNTAWGTRFVVPVGVIPSNATQLGVVLSYVPVGTAGSNDWIQATGLQMEQGTAPSQFEHLDIQMTLEIAQRYFWSMSEPASGVVVGAGMNTTTSAQVFYIALPVQMVKAPTVTVSAGTFKTNQANTATSTTITAGSTHTVNAITVNGSSTGTAGQGTLLQGGGGSGYVWASAEF